MLDVFVISDEATMNEIKNKNIINKTLTKEKNNYAFLNLTAEDMKYFKELLIDFPLTDINIVYSEFQDEVCDKTLNLVYDCFEDDLSVLLDSESLNNKLSDAYQHITISLINFQEIKDQEIIKKISETIQKSMWKICFNVFTKDKYLDKNFSLSNDNEEKIKLVLLKR